MLITCVTIDFKKISENSNCTKPSLVKGKRLVVINVFFLGPEHLNNSLGTSSHMKGTCIAANFESNGPLVW